MKRLSHWKEMPLGAIAPSAPSIFPEPNQTVWNLSLEEIEPVTGRILQRTFCNTSDLGPSKCAFDERHVLYSKLRPYLNKVALPDGPGVGTSELVPLCPAPEQMDREYLAYYLRSPRFLDFAKANTRGANLPRIAMQALWSHTVPMPSAITEQRRIVARIKECMERVGEGENLRKDSLIEAKQLAPALYEAIEAEGNSPLKRVGEVIVGSRNGRSITQNNSNPTGFVLSLSSVREVILDESARKPIQLPELLAKQFCIRKGDVFVSRANTRELVGLASVAESAPARLIFPDLLIKLEASQDVIHPRFLAYALRTRSSRRQIQERSVGTSQSMVKISAERLKEVAIRVPPLKDQSRILDELDAARNALHKTASELSEDVFQNLRDAILRKAFAGEL